MKELNYIIENRTVAEILGVQNFTNQETAILEIVKNAYDANATELTIEFKENAILISDNGCGMNENDILTHWMHIGKSDKGYETEDDQGNKRVVAGQKGVGRFALARLASIVEVHSLKSNHTPVFWKTDWSKNTLDFSSDQKTIGTSMYLYNLRDNWSQNRIKSLQSFLSITYNDDLMKVTLIDNLGQTILLNSATNHIVNRYFAKPHLGINCTNIIKLNYVATEMKLYCTVQNDEFKDDAIELCPDLNIHEYSITLDVLNEIDFSKSQLYSENLRDNLMTLGNFSCEFYFSVRGHTQIEGDKFLYKYTMLPKRYSKGITLYRNAFSIANLEGSKDWLELGKRSRMSPAAASHPTGSWRVRENQISGVINIDKKANANLIDLANRQGMSENDHYKIFITIIQNGVMQFERYRQKIIRNMTKKTYSKTDVKKQENILDKVLKDEVNLFQLSLNEQNEFKNVLKEQKKEQQRSKTESKKEFEEQEKRYKYDVGILNVLATSGLKSTSMAHEFHNDLNNFDGISNRIKKAMERYGIWEIAMKDENRALPHADIPRLLDNNETKSKKIVAFMRVILDQVEKKEFIQANQNIYTIIYDRLSDWKDNHSCINFNLLTDKELEFFISEDVIKVILDNLILNSMQQNKNTNTLNLSVEAERVNNFLKISYSDDGIGLSEKYKNDPMKILEVHETSRDDGHGLGMWIVSNTINLSGGSINTIISDNGFKIDFNLGGKSRG